MTTETPNWDRDLAPDEVKRLKPEDRGHRAAASFERKVELLERYARDGIPAGAEKDIPTDRAKLRRWSDAGLRLWAWADPAVDHPTGRHGTLHGRFQAALEVIEARRSGRGSDLKKEIAAKDVIIANLERQNAALLDQVRQLQKLVGVQPVTRR